MSTEPTVIAEVDGVKFYRIREATEEDPIVGWEEIRKQEPSLRVHLRSGVTLFCNPPHPKMRKIGVVHAGYAWKSRGVPLISIDPDDKEPTLTDRKDIVELVCCWVDGLVKQESKPDREDTSARRQP